MQVGRIRRARRFLSLTPLIDVVFLLLIFFMLATTFLDSRRVEISVPQIDRGAAAGPTDGFTIAIRPAGRIEINGRAATLAEVEARVRARLQLRPGQPIQVAPSAAVPLQRVMDVLDRIAAAGGRAVTLERQNGARR
jgi:biopolymer transport protein ExbD